MEILIVSMWYINLIPERNFGSVTLCLSTDKKDWYFLLFMLIVPIDSRISSQYVLKDVFGSNSSDLDFIGTIKKFVGIFNRWLTTFISKR